MKVHKSESIKEAVDNLHEFFDCDLYSKFRPEEKIPNKKGKMETWVREDTFPNEKEFSKYLKDHFGIVRKEIIRLIGKKKYSSKSQEESKE